ncbi:CycB3 [Cordylochernes scorpioides]|uniref:CycB3 n=1 Tax=Cordylochernes scorpioides TaxID=51811 RepID=A0ABY6KND3_9ARAC|nr:CycB3 [Cordylochernes scorpioides]
MVELSELWYYRYCRITVCYLIGRRSGHQNMVELRSSPRENIPERCVQTQLVMQPYMERQPEVTANMRAILVDWMVEVQENFELNHETLYLAVRLMDVYLGSCAMPKARLQLLGATSILLAAKYDERSPPLVEDFLYICDDAYSRQDVLRMEHKLLVAAGFQLGMPLSYRFLRRFARCNQDTLVTLTLARYLLELSLLNYDMNVGLKESLKAAAVLFLARLLQGLKPVWTPNLVHHTGYQVHQFATCLEPLHQPLVTPSNSLRVVREKYSHRSVL